MPYSVMNVVVSRTMNKDITNSKKFVVMKEIIYRRVEELTLLEDNPRKISVEQMERLKESIDKNPDYFECRPVILSDRTGELVVIAGNQRVKAATAIGLKAVPTILLSGLTEEREKEIIIRDNVNNGEWDEELLAEWDAALLDDLGVDISALSEKDFSSTGEENREAKEDDFDEEGDKIETVCQLGDVWKLGEHRLMCGDSTNVEMLKILTGGAEMDLYVTDPPYNVAYEGGTDDHLRIMNDKMEDGMFLEFLTKAFVAAVSVLKSGGAVYCWYAIWKHTSFEEALKRAGIDVKQQLIWNKGSLVLGRQDYQWKHEPCLYGWKEGASHYFIEERTHTTVIEDAMSMIPEKMKKGELVKALKAILGAGLNTTVIDEKKPARNGEHPTMKPVALIGRLIRNSSRIGEKVLDTFGGSGTTMIACEQLGRKCYMMEIDPHYCDVIIARWEKFTGKKAVKVNG